MGSSYFRSALYALLFCSLLQSPGITSIDTAAPKIQARIEFDSWEEYERFTSRSDLDMIEVRPGVDARIVTEYLQLAALHSMGFALQVEIENMQEYYAAGIRGDNFGAYHTYSETTEFLDHLHAMYPSITTEKMSIGLTHEGRDIWALKISDNPEIDENEPEVLFDGLHHAREIMATEVILNFMKWLCEGYGFDVDATFLVDNREIWCVPIVNPDGIVYNETTDPGGGGMWRKNRRDNGDGTFGVDLNRNYPYEWGCENSSDDPSTETYRGPSAGSEPEVQAMIAFMIDHEFVSHISFHSFCSFVFVPWDYTAELAPDHDLLMWLGNRLAYYNGYNVSSQDGGYGGSLCGTTIDYSYGEQTEKNKTMASVIEIGLAFWPEGSEIHSLNQEILWPQIFNSKTAGVFLDITEAMLVGGNENELPDAGETLDLHLTVENQSLFDGAANARISLHTDDPYVQIQTAYSTFGAVPVGGVSSNQENPLCFSIDPVTPEGHPIEVALLIEANRFSLERRMTWMVGTSDSLFADDFENGMEKWVVSDGTWGLTTAESHSPSYSVTDSPDGDYSFVQRTWIELAEPLVVSQRRSACVSFWHRYDTEPDNDICFVDASGDGGRTWWPTCGRYHGLLEEWRPETISLHQFAGSESLTVRFRLRTRWGENEDGWYIDDVVIHGSPADNIPPTAPMVASPAPGASVHSATPTLTVYNASDPDGPGGLTYGFLIYRDEHFIDVITSVSGIEEGVDSTSWTVDEPLDLETYWWRVYADDGIERGLLMPGASFTIEELSALPTVPLSISLSSPKPNPFQNVSRITFDLPYKGLVILTVYNINGRLVRTLLDGVVERGRTTITWDGRDDGGILLANGLYLVQLEVDDSLLKRPAVVLR